MLHDDELSKEQVFDAGNEGGNHDMIIDDIPENIDGIPPSKSSLEMPAGEIPANEAQDGIPTTRHSSVKRIPTK